MALTKACRTEGTRAGPPEVLQALAEGGPVDPSQYWFHLHVKIETGREKHKWTNNELSPGEPREQRERLPTTLITSRIGFEPVDANDHDHK